MICCSIGVVKRIPNSLPKLRLFSKRIQLLNDTSMSWISLMFFVMNSQIYR